MTQQRREFYLSFLLGCSVGILFTIIYTEFIVAYRACYGVTNAPNNPLLTERNIEFKAEDLSDHHEILPQISNKAPHKPIIFNDLDSLHRKGGDKIAKHLASEIRVLCWVMTQPKSLRTKGQAVKDTWGKRCNVLVFISSVEDKDFPAVGLDVPEGRENLWLKTRAAWSYIYKHHINDADWFIKADDDSFIILENLRYFVSKYNSSQPHYFGRHFVPFGGYNSGGAGYVFSKATLKSFNRIIKDPSKCKLKSFAEDAEVGVCLAAVGIHPGDTRDALGRETFHPFAPDYHILPGAIPKDNWLHKYNKWPLQSGPECCSDHTIAFHYITPNKMYVMEYFVYHLHPYGIHHRHLK